MYYIYLHIYSSKYLLIVYKYYTMYKILGYRIYVDIITKIIIIKNSTIYDFVILYLPVNFSVL